MFESAYYFAVFYILYISVFTSEELDLLSYFKSFMSFQSVKALLAPSGDSNGNIPHALLMMHMQSTGESGSPGYQHKD